MEINCWIVSGGSSIEEPDEYANATVIINVNTVSLNG